MENKLYHITTFQEWEAAQNYDEYQPQEFSNEGFIHCSYKHQLIRVANFIFRGQKNLIILVIDPNKIPSKIVPENLEGGAELFPHIYGKLPLKSVISTIPFPCELEGNFSLPASLK